MINQDCKNWNESKMKIETTIKENGMPMIKLTKVNNSTLGKGKNSFSSKECNLFISETKVRPQPNERKFCVSIRRIGSYKNEGEFKLNQISLTKAELEQLRDELNKIL